MTPREQRLRRQYGLEPGEYEVILAYQGGGCALCGARARTTMLPVDHRHSTGVTTGILCNRCNRGLREFMTLDWLERAAAYLAEPPAEAALGRVVQGRTGRVTNHRRRRKIAKV